MPLQEDVLKIGKKLEKMVSSKSVDQATAMELLMQLKKQKMNLEVLQKTKIGMIVNNFRKSTKDDEVISLARSLIKSWKKLIGDSGKKDTKEKGKSVHHEGGQEFPRTDSTLSTMSDDYSQSPTDSQRKDSPNPANMHMIRSYPERVSHTSDPIRLKCREMLVNALKSGDLPTESNDPVDVAAAIEDHIFNEFGNTDNKYKNRVRSRVLNLRDSKNPKLRENVLMGYISAERIAIMTAEDMASDEMKELREKFTKQAINDHQMAVRGGTATSLIKCGKCGKRSVLYNQVQTRSADEPMTTFCLCQECGHRWKFC
ncbi:DgyrCDS1448 [Dimorphilus gyrociliatus]|uniref:Transcription elongation factor n=1 Tax=Dimorphilus gyrociliatus TaxID=2664684 RepID=A0A7I8V8V6_9ANNE|nr:DgyrCDS1448 [Dimorphilus gyrociliatus]